MLSRAAAWEGGRPGTVIQKRKGAKAVAATPARQAVGIGGLQRLGTERPALPLRNPRAGIDPGGRYGPEDPGDFLASLRGAPILYGSRGGSAVDIDALVRLLVRLGGPGGLWESLDLGEFELNPVIAGQDGVIAVDARYI